MDSHFEVIPWMRPGHPPRGSVTAIRAGEVQQSGTVLSATWMSGEALTPSEVAELNEWTVKNWDMPFNN